MSYKFALVIANTDYQDTTFAKLTAPGQDAKEFAKILRDPEICSFEDVRVLNNASEGRTRREIASFFSKRKRDDLLLLYLSGHGIRNEQGKLFLAVSDTETGILEATGVSAEFITRAMNNSRSHRQLLILDCCNSGAFAYGSKSAVGVGSSMGIGTAFEGSGYGRVVLTATDATQYAWEGDKVIGKTQKSVFTHFLIEGLKGEADRNGDGRIDVDELYDYAYDQVVQRTPKQTPGKWSYKQQGDIFLRDNLTIRDVGPAPIPSDLLELLTHSNPSVRVIGLNELISLIDGNHLGLARAGQDKLREIAASDDSLSIRKAADDALKAREISLEVPAPPEKSRERLENEKPAYSEVEELQAEIAAEQSASPVTQPYLRERLAAWNINYRLFGIATMVIVALLIIGLGGNFIVQNWPLSSLREIFSSPEQPSKIVSKIDGMTLVHIPGGEFTMGSSTGNLDEKPVEKIFLEAYWIDQTEVTNAMYNLCVSAGACALPTDSRSNNHPEYHGNPEYDNFPVIFIDWQMAKVYCEWAERRLPTEAEWEKAARGTDERLYPWGDEAPSSEMLNFNRIVGDTAEVGIYPDGASAYGVLDMGGNVWEWVSSAYIPYPYDPEDGREDLSSEDLRVLRGGSWESDASLVRSTFRGNNDPRQSLINIGFRCASSLVP